MIKMFSTMRNCPGRPQVLNEKQFQHLVDKIIEGRGSVEAMNVCRDVAAALYSRLMAEGFSLVSFLIGEDYENQQRRFFGDFNPPGNRLKVPPADVQDTGWMDSVYAPGNFRRGTKRPLGKNTGGKKAGGLDKAGGKRYNGTIQRKERKERKEKRNG